MTLRFFAAAALIASAAASPVYPAVATCDSSLRSDILSGPVGPACGRGIGDCADGKICVTDPVDRWAVCCEPAPLCPAGQVYTECGSGCGVPTCGDEPSLICPAVCTQGCFCPAGQVLNPVDNTCVAPEACPVVDEPECQLPSCAAPPAESCIANWCDFDVEACEFRPTVYVNDGEPCLNQFSLGADKICMNGACVEPEPLCPAGQIYKECGSGCGAPTCGDEPSQICPAVCTQGCFCPDGQVFNPVDNTCVAPEACPVLGCVDAIHHWLDNGYPAGSMVNRAGCAEYVANGWCGDGQNAPYAYPEAHSSADAVCCGCGGGVITVEEELPADWVDSDGYGCSVYVSQNWCNDPYNPYYANPAGSDQYANNVCAECGAAGAEVPLTCDSPLMCCPEGFTCDSRVGAGVCKGPNDAGTHPVKC